jgi:MYXO-CTERM domain-containing protein
VASQCPTPRPTDTPSPVPTPTRLPPATPTSPRATATPTSTPLRIADDGCAIAPTPRSGSLWMWTLGLALVVLRRRRASHETSPRPSPWDRLSIFSEQPFDTPPILRYALRATLRRRLLRNNRRCQARAPRYAGPKTVRHSGRTGRKPATGRRVPACQKAQQRLSMLLGTNGNDTRRRSHNRSSLYGSTEIGEEAGAPRDS